MEIQTTTYEKLILNCLKNAFNYVPKIKLKKFFVWKRDREKEFFSYFFYSWKNLPYDSNKVFFLIRFNLEWLISFFENFQKSLAQLFFYTPISQVIFERTRNIENCL